jgi:hypothetical protein
VSDMISGATAGAEIGSLVEPGIGTVVGGVIGGLAGLASDIFGAGTSASNTYQQATLQAAEANANIGLYQQYLNAFPGYASNQEQMYKTEEAQTLGERLQNMGMRGISGGKGTSAAAGYGTQQSLYEEGYNNLVTSLQLQEAEAQTKLSVYQASLTNATTAQKNAENSVGGFFDQLGNWISGKGWTM